MMNELSGALVKKISTGRVYRIVNSHRYGFVINWIPKNVDYFSYQQEYDIRTDYWFYAFNFLTKDGGKIVDNYRSVF